MVSSTLSSQRLEFNGPGSLRLVESPLGDLLPGQFRIQNRFALVSPGTELALLYGTTGRFPRTPGYCSLGEVCAVGGAGQGVQVGETVLHISLHENYTTLSAEDRHRWIVVRENGQAATALVARFYQIAWAAIYALGQRPKSCVVSGAGLIGLCAAQLLQRLGTDVTLVSGNPVRLALAGQCGIRAQPRHLLDWAKTGCVIDATGHPEHVLLALSSMRPGATLVLLGSPRGPLTVDLYKTVHRKGLRVFGAHELLIPPNDTENIPGRRTMLQRAVEMVMGDPSRVAPLLEKVVEVSQLSESYAALQQREAAFPSFVIRWP